MGQNDPEFEEGRTLFSTEQIKMILDFLKFLVVVGVVIFLAIMFPVQAKELIGGGFTVLLILFWIRISQ